MPRCFRKSTPKVRDGKTQRKNRTALTPNLRQTRLAEPSVLRERPGRTFRHVLRQDDVRRFVRLLPDWPELSQGLNAIVLARGSSCHGWHRPGVVAVCAWDRNPFQYWSRRFYLRHRDIISQLGVPVRPLEPDDASLELWIDQFINGEEAEVVCEFSDESIRAFQLLHILLHELGHHHDRMTSRRQRHCTRGEPFAERYARLHARRIWERYCQEFHFHCAPAAMLASDGSP